MRRTRRGIRAAVAGVLTILWLYGCASPSMVYKSPEAKPIPLDPTVLVLPSDVSINLWTAGGLEERRADWSREVAEKIKTALTSAMYERGVQFAHYEDELEDEDLKLIKRLYVVLDSIDSSLRAGRTGSISLQGSRDYSVDVGENSRLGQASEHYALLVVLKANRGSGMRILTSILAGATTGKTVPTEAFLFRCVLIDLRDGTVVWANIDDDASQDIGDPLKLSEDRWSEKVDHLLQEFPL